MASLVHVKAKSKWKPVEIDQSGGDFEGLISLEVLDDYELLSGDGSVSRQAKKRDECQEDSGKKKKRKKKKRKKGQGHEDDEEPKNVELCHTDEQSGDGPGLKKKKKLTNQGIQIVISQPGNSSPEKTKLPKQKTAKTGTKRKMQEEPYADDSDGDKHTDNTKDTEVRKTKLSTGIKQKKLKPGIKRKRRKEPDSDDSEDDEDTDKEIKDTEKILSLSPDKKRKINMESWQTFSLSDNILRALGEAGFAEPTPIQAASLPSAIRDRMNILGAAETGSGKTLAFGLPVIEQILHQQRQKDDESEDEDDLVSDEGEVDYSEEGESGEGKEELEGKSSDGEDDENEEESVEGEEEEEGDEGEGKEELEMESSDGEEEENEIGSEEEEEDQGAEFVENSSDGESGEEDESDDENKEESGSKGAGKGCVRVVKDVDMSWLEHSKQSDEISGKKNIKVAPSALILEPTRELAKQVKQHLDQAAKYTDIKVDCIVGGFSMAKQERLLKRCPEIIVATPGRLWEFVQQKNDFLSKIDKISSLVVDEADRMVEKGHFEELEKIVEYIHHGRKPTHHLQTYVFSATLTMLHPGPLRAMKKKAAKLTEKQKLELLMQKLLLKSKVKVIDLSRKAGTVETLTEAKINCTVQEKDVYLYYFLKQYPGKTLVFTNSKDCIRRLVSVLTLLKCSPLPLHADMHQRQRMKNLDRFTSNERGLLLASDVAARGLDIPSVQHVVHYQVPQTVENYVHRSGRTARANKEGLSVVLIGQEEMKNYRKIIHTLNRGEDLPQFPVDMQILSEVKSRVNLARQIDVQEYRFKKKKLKNDWFLKAAEKMDIELDDEHLLNDLGDSYEQNRHKQQIRQLKMQLDDMLKTSMIPRVNFSGKYPTKSGSLRTLEGADQDRSALQQVKKAKIVEKGLLKDLAKKNRQGGPTQSDSRQQKAQMKKKMKKQKFRNKKKR